MNIPIVFEDSSLVVIDKPSGLTVNHDQTTVGQETVQDWAEARVHSSRFIVDSRADEEFVSRSGIVHRLDKDTSGLLVIAKTPEAFANLKDQFKSREVVKKYLALVHGEVLPPQGTIKVPVGRSPFNNKHFGVFPGGREAETGYKTYRTYKTYTLLELSPHTGRTHQIRVHLKYIGHPIVSDPVYAGRKTYRSDLRLCPRLFLHAKYLRIKHPTGGEPLEFNSPLPSDLQDVLDRLQ